MTGGYHGGESDHSVSQKRPSYPDRKIGFVFCVAVLQSILNPDATEYLYEVLAEPGTISGNFAHTRNGLS